MCSRVNTIIIIDRCINISKLDHYIFHLPLAGYGTFSGTGGASNGASGGGSGGRVSIHCSKQILFEGSFQFFGGEASSGVYAGGAGTVYLQDVRLASTGLIIPPATKLGGYTGITMSVRPSIHPSVCPATFGFPAHNCFPFTPIIMKLHMQTPHEARMCPIDFEVKRSRSQCINY